MSRSYRLFDLLQMLRTYRGAVSGGVLARELGVSLRTVRRDMAALQAMGAEIRAEAGVGYALGSSFVLPPLTFTEEELHALAIGAEWVSRQSDTALAGAVRNALAKIESVLSPQAQHALDGTSFYVAPAPEIAPNGFDLAELRRALREQRKVRLLWRREDGTGFERTVWPIMLGFNGTQRSFAGWCESEGGFALFREEQILQSEVLSERYPRNRRQLVKDWRAIAAETCSRQTSSR